MRFIFLTFLSALIVLQPACAQEAPTPTTDYKVVGKYPHDSKAFTQGLLFDRGVFYEGTGHYKQSRIRRVNIGTGRVLKEWKFPDQLFGEGLTLVGDHLFGLSWRAGVGVVLTRENLELLGYFRYEGQGWGLTDDGRNLYMSDGSDRIYVRDPRNFEVISTIDVKDQGKAIIRLNELEWINGEIWANIWKESRIARIDPKTGTVKSWLDLTEIVENTENADTIDNVLNGIAHDPRTGHVFVTGKYWPTLYALEIADFKPFVNEKPTPKKTKTEK